MKKLHYLIILFFTLFYYNNSQGQNNTDIYVSAHADDWQLFMNPNAYKDVKSSDHKVVFIHTTAGDAGAGIGNNNYYLAREEGSLRALRFMSNTFASGADLGTNMNQTNVTINGHQILKYSYRNIVAYFLRLSDGSGNGSGYTSTGNESLQRLYNGSISSISAIDGSTTYNSITDFTNTMQSIVELEINGSQSITFNIADDDDSINPGDHSDHIHSSKVFQNVANNIGGIEINLYSEYHTQGRNQNVFGNDYLVSAGTWGVTTSGLSDNFHNSTWDGIHNAWIGKQYYRVVNVDPNPDTTTNIALNKPSSASSNEPTSESSEANDGNYSSNNNYWGANPHGEWWQVDLQDTYNVNKIVVTNYHLDNRYYQYDIEASTDGVNWTEIVDFNDNTTLANSQGNTFEGLNATARYLRVNMNFNSANIGVHIVEFEAYGELDLASKFSENATKILLYPNPVKKGSSITINASKFKVGDVILLEVNDLNNLIFDDTVKLDKTKNIMLNTENFAKGLYIIILTFKDKKISRKIYIE